MSNEQETVEQATHPLEITDDLTTIKHICREMVGVLQRGPRSRERSLVITKLEEAAMWANAAQAVE